MATEAEPGSIRDPISERPGDAGWHIDGSFDVGGEMVGELGSRNRALLTLFLSTHVGRDDAPTRVLIGSHQEAPVLEPVGKAGTHFERILPLLADVQKRKVALATGEAGDVHLCHPFLVHAASWPHRGATPRFLALPALPPAALLELERRRIFSG